MGQYDYEIVSYIGGILLATNMWPQIYKTYTTKQVTDLSATTLTMTFSGLLLMIIYSIHINDMSLYAPLLLNEFNTFTLLCMKIQYNNNIREIEASTKSSTIVML